LARPSKKRETGKKSIGLHSEKSETRSTAQQQEYVRRLVWVGEVVDTGIGITNKPNHESLELEGVVGTEKVTPYAWAAWASNRWWILKPR
jgi:hypothetical protein